MDSATSLPSSEGGQAPCRMNLCRRGFVTVDFLLGDLSSGVGGSAEEASPLSVLLFQWPQLQRINSPKWHMLGWPSRSSL